MPRGTPWTVRENEMANEGLDRRGSPGSHFARADRRHSEGLFGTGLHGTRAAAMTYEI
jgi:hypothetical protein